MWSAEVGGHFHSKNRLVSSRKHRATEVRKLLFFLPVNILTGVTRRLLGLHVCLDVVESEMFLGVTCDGEFTALHSFDNSHTCLK